MHEGETTLHISVLTLVTTNKSLLTHSVILMTGKLPTKGKSKEDRQKI